MLKTEIPPSQRDAGAVAPKWIIGGACATETLFVGFIALVVVALSQFS